MQRGTYNFILGVKTPNLDDAEVNARLIVAVDGAAGEMEAKLTQRTVMPFVRCSKELFDEEGFQMVKIAAMGSKQKKETKIVFRCSENLNFILMADFLGATEESGNEVEVKPRMVQVGGEGLFVLNICANFPSELSNQRVCVRRVLVLQIKDSACHFHFPVEVIFYPDGSLSSQAE